MFKLKRILKSTIIGGLVVLAYFLMLAIQGSELIFAEVSIRSAVFLFIVFFFVGYSVSADDEKEGGG